MGSFIHFKYFLLTTCTYPYYLHSFEFNLFCLFSFFLLLEFSTKGCNVKNGKLLQICPKSHSVCIAMNILSWRMIAEFFRNGFAGFLSFPLFFLFKDKYIANCKLIFYRIKKMSWTHTFWDTDC